MPECPPAAASWTPDLTGEKLEFLDAPGGTFTIPNYMLDWENWGAAELQMSREFEGSDRDTVIAVAAHRRVERKRTARIQCKMSWWYDAAGVAFDSAVEGWTENLSTINALADLSVSDPQGLQTVRWTPYGGATPITFEATVQRPIPGQKFRNVGMYVGLVIEVPDPGGQGL